MTAHTLIRLALAAAVALAALLVSPDDARACGSWEEKEEKILALDAEGTRALVLETTTQMGYGESTARHRLFVVDLRGPRTDGPLLLAQGRALEIRLSVREQTMPTDALVTRLARRHVAWFLIRTA